MDDVTQLLRTAFDSYLTRMKSGGLEPSDSFLPYDFAMIDGFQWSLLGGYMAKDEMQGLTNNLNHWHSLLVRWHAWNDVIVIYGEEDAWELRHEFLDALAHQCLLQPSAIRDTFIFVVTNAMHQIRLASEKDYQDYMEGDPTTPGDKPRHLTRKRKEIRLAKLISSWPESSRLMTSLYKIDDKQYRQLTADYRNLISHCIGPRLGIGITQAVVRNVRQTTEMTKQPDGTFIPTPVPGKMCVSYSFGGTGPLDMEKARVANLEQYRRARECYENYRKLLAVGLASNQR